MPIDVDGLDGCCAPEAVAFSLRAFLHRTDPGEGAVFRHLRLIGRLLCMTFAAKGHPPGRQEAHQNCQSPCGFPLPGKAWRQSACDQPSDEAGASQPPPGHRSDIPPACTPYSRRIGNCDPYKRHPAPHLPDPPTAKLCREMPVLISTTGVLSPVRSWKKTLRICRKPDNFSGSRWLNIHGP